jgi:hypothetical protein
MTPLKFALSITPGMCLRSRALEKRGMGYLLCRKLENGAKYYRKKKIIHYSFVV